MKQRADKKACKNRAQSSPSADTSRKKQGAVTGLVGLVLNLVLGGGKLAVGLLSGSVSITSDAANNLSDAGNSMVAVGSFLLGGRKADKEHPYGHARYEYIASLLIGVVIVLVGFEFAISSVEKIIAPAAVALSPVLLGVLLASIAVKLFMGIFYRVRARKLQSDTLVAASWDSFFDCIVTGAVIAGLLLTLVCPPWVDGAVGLAVSAVILLGGIKLLLGTVKRLLGEKCDDETAQKIVDLVRSDPLVVGTHDLRVHDYGPGHMLASIHAEFDRNIGIAEAHTVIDALEHRAYAEMGIELVVHVDPIDTTDSVLNHVRRTIKKVIADYAGTSIHDLSIQYDEQIVSFHLSLPERYVPSRDCMIQTLTDEITAVVGTFAVLVEVDILYE